jgi:hypothetical protein
LPGAGVAGKVEALVGDLAIRWTRATIGAGEPPTLSAVTRAGAAVLGPVAVAVPTHDTPTEALAGSGNASV